MTRRKKSQKVKMVNLHHIVTAPKFRRDLLRDERVAYTVESAMRFIADRHGIKIHALAIQNDHVHLFIDIPRRMSVAKAVQLLKWFSSLRARAEHPALTTARVPGALWAVRYYHDSVGVNRQGIKSYIDRQMRKI